ncbi:YoaK family protein [Mucilaginibacter sp. McL0603]|uniref:YoaK family protein n=1 Tax=Mucilaginibacter sp. McL0603 TaxID=3415670 RepID=UPI003CEB229C
MEQEKLVGITSLLLSFVAGFCDTVTFVAAGELFSAHVTGNFIVFAYDIIKHANAGAWQKLLTFPVFILAVMTGGRISRKWTNMYILLILEGILLLISGLMALALKNVNDTTQWQVLLIAMIIVVALGFQNTFGKLFNKATYGLTTIMTGNVTQASLDFIKVVTVRPFDADAWGSLKKLLFLIVGFLFGCLFGALMAAKVGLCAVILPGFILLFWLFKINRLNGKT